MTGKPTGPRVPERDLGPVAVLIGDPTRAAMLAALAGGRALPAGDLARHADRAARTLGEARTCYDHLAGRRGVQLRDRLIVPDALHRDDGLDHVLTGSGRESLRALGVDVHSAGSGRRVFARSCVDWTQRRPHLAGALPAAITARLVELRWLRRGPGRGVRVSTDFDDNLNAWLPPTSEPPPAEPAPMRPPLGDSGSVRGG